MRWVRREPVVKVKYLAWAGANLLRQLVYEGARLARQQLRCQRWSTPATNKRNSNDNRRSNNSVRADNTPLVHSKLGRLGSSRSSRTGSNRHYSRGLRARSRG